MKAAILLAAALLAGAQEPPEVPAPEYFGVYNSAITELREPAGVAFDQSGELWVAEPPADRVRRFDAAGRETAVLADGLSAPHGVAAAGELVYVTDTGNDRVVVFDQTGAVVRQWGGVRAPHGIAVGEFVYVADTGNDRVAVFDLEGRFVRAFGSAGRGPRELNRPLDVAVDDLGTVYVADTDNHRIVRFDAAGGHAGGWGAFGSFPGIFAEPGGVAWHGGVLYVADTLNHRVQVFDAEGRFLYQWGLHAVFPRQGEGRIHYPNALAVGPGGDLIAVAEAFEQRCQLFSRSPEPPPVGPLRPKRGLQSHFGRPLAAGGDLLAAWDPETRSIAVFYTGREVPVLITRFGEHGWRHGQLGRVTSLDLDGAVLYVGDAVNDRVAVYQLAFDPVNLRFDPAMSRLSRTIDLGRADPPGEPRRIDPAAIAHEGAGGMLVLDGAGRRLLAFDAQMALVRSFGDTVLRHPVDAALADGIVYVADAWAGRVEVFGLADGRHLFGWGDAEGPGRLVRPASIAAGPDGFIYVTDEAADAIVKFDRRGRFVAAWGGTGTEAGQLWEPGGIALDGSGRVMVMDYGNHRVQAFSADGAWLVTFGAGRAFASPEPAEPAIPDD